MDNKIHLKEMLNETNNLMHISTLIDLGVDSPNINMDAIFADICACYNYESFIQMHNDYRIDSYAYENRAVYYALSVGNYTNLEVLVDGYDFYPFKYVDNYDYVGYIDYYFSCNNMDEDIIKLLVKIYVDNNRNLDAIKQLKNRGIDYKKFFK